MNTCTPSLQEAIEVLLKEQQETGKAVIEYTTSMLQRKLRLGYTPTVALMNELEKQGFVRRISETAIQVMFDAGQDSSQETIDKEQAVGRAQVTTEGCTTFINSGEPGSDNGQL